MNKYTVPHGRCCGLLWYVIHCVGDLEIIDGMRGTQSEAQKLADRLNGVGT